MHLFTCSNKKHSDKKGGLSAFGECVLVFSFAFLLIFFAFCTFVFADPLKVYLENYFLNGYRIGGDVISVHSGDSISYVQVSSGVTYYSDRNIAFFNSTGLGKNTPVSPVTFPFTPSVDGYLVVNDIVDGTMTDLQVYYFSEDPDDPGTEDPDDPGTEDPDDPGTEDPDDPGPDVPFFDNSIFEKIIDLLYVLIFLEFVNFVFPLSRSWIKSLIGGKND